MLRSKATSLLVAVAACVALNAWSAAAVADDTTGTTDPARQAFREGAALVEQSEWASALAAFERSRAAREHALTLYNIGVCQRFLGRYTLARETLRAALARSESTGEMSSLFVEQGRAYVREIDAKLARFVVTLDPKAARVAVEGRPLSPSSDDPNVLIAGTAESGEGQPIGLTRFDVLVDPRPLVLTFSLDGYDTIEVRKDPKPGSREELSVSMAEQPAQIRIGSNVRGAVVRVDGVDVGLTPVMVSRPPGVRLVSVTMDGYVPYESRFTLRPGQAVPVDAKLTAEKVALTKKWWFWVGTAAILSGVGLGTYFIVRPEPSRPVPQAGGLGWIAEVR